MRYLLILSLLIVYSVNGYSQDTLRHYLNDDFLITSKDSATILREIILQEDYYKMSYYNMEGVEFNYCELKSMDPFIMHGISKHYYEPGIIYSTGKYNRGKLMGKWQYYNREGVADTVIYQPVAYYKNKMGYTYDKSNLSRPTIETEQKVRESVTSLLRNKMHLPARTRSKSTSVSFYMKVIVDIDGELKDVEIFDSDDEDLQIEVYRILSMYNCDFTIKKAFETTLSYTYNEKSSPNDASLIAETFPEFPGGELEMRKYLAHSVRYPIYAQENGIMGCVFVSFIIDKNGKIQDARIARGVHYTLDEEA